MEDGCTSTDTHRDNQSNHKYREGSLLKDSKNGASKNKDEFAVAETLRSENLWAKRVLNKLAEKYDSLFLATMDS